jgi:hypothetical protein
MKQCNKPVQVLIVLAHALVGWMYCGALIGVGRQFMSMYVTLIVHAIGAPFGFILISLLYFKKFAFTSPLQTALLFVGFAVVMDVFVVAVFIEKSFEMFTSFLGTWLPLALIFLATYLTGAISRSREISNTKEGTMKTLLLVMTVVFCISSVVCPVFSEEKKPEIKDGVITFPESAFPTVSLSKFSFSFPPDSPKEMLNVKGKILRGEMVKEALGRVVHKSVAYLIPLSYKSDTKEISFYFAWERGTGGKPGQGRIQGVLDLENASTMKFPGASNIAMEYRLYFLKDSKIRLNASGGSSGDFTPVGNLPE